MSIDTHDLIDWVNDKQSEQSKQDILKENGLLHKGSRCTYEQLTDAHEPCFSRKTSYGHTLVVVFPATGHPANIHYHCFFKPEGKQAYECLESYIKSKGRAVKIVRNAYKKLTKQNLPD